MTQYISAAQPWLNDIPIMQQSVLFSALRGHDGFPKGHPTKALLRWYRRCVLISAMDGRVLDDPFAPGGGDFTGPAYGPEWNAQFTADEFPAIRLSWVKYMRGAVEDFVTARDQMSFHYFGHALHAFQIVGYHHPDSKIAAFWLMVYVRMCHTLHVFPETQEDMDRRLSDDERRWRERSDEAGSCST